MRFFPHRSGCPIHFRQRHESVSLSFIFLPLRDFDHAEHQVEPEMLGGAFVCESRQVLWHATHMRRVGETGRGSGSSKRAPARTKRVPDPRPGWSARQRVRERGSARTGAPSGHAALIASARVTSLPRPPAAPWMLWSSSCSTVCRWKRVRFWGSRRFIAAALGCRI